MPSYQIEENQTRFEITRIEKGLQLSGPTPPPHSSPPAIR